MHKRIFRYLSGSASNFALALLLCISASACSGLGLETEESYENKSKSELYKNGSIVSDGGGFNLLGSGDVNKDSSASGIGVNGYLWRAALDTVSFMPISSADPFGGVITSDWHSSPDAPNERVKLNIFILDRDLRADGVRVSVFRQTRGVEGEWTDAPVSPTTASSLENSILTRARQMRLAQKEVK